MLEKYNRYKVLKVFFDSPTKEFGLRKIGRKASLAPVSVMNYLKEFEKKGLIEKKKEGKVSSYIARRGDENFVFYKKIGFLNELHNSGLIEELWYKLSPKTIILYGSYAKGEAIENSDIDIFIIGKEKKINLNKFEEKLNGKIHLMFSEDLKNVGKELINNLVNGIILKGYFKVLK